MKTCLVTGGSRGLGREIALAFAKSAFGVAFCYRSNHEAAARTTEELKAFTADTVAFQCDVSDRTQVDQMFLVLRGRWPRLDVLVNNAGITLNALLARQSVKQWDSIIGTNLTGAFWCLRGAAEWMAEQRGGQIVNICSISGVEGREGQTAYAASKAALIGLTKSAARELGEAGICVNAVLPGLLPTAMGEALSEKEANRQVARSALGRAGHAEQVAGFIVQLVQMENVSGQVFNLDSRIISS